MGIVYLGQVPADEPCAQVGTEGYVPRQKAECLRLIKLLRKVIGPEPQGATLRILGQPHDFGTYYEVVCRYEEDNEEATEYAYRCEAEYPLRWEEDAG